MSETTLTGPPPTEALTLFQQDAIQRVKGGIESWLDSDDIAVFEAKLADLIETTAAIENIAGGNAYTVAVDQWKLLGELRKEITAHFDIAKKPLNAFHKQVSSAASNYENRIRTEENRLGALAGNYAAEQERARAADQRRLQQQQQQKVAQERRDEAAAAQQAGASPAEVQAVASAPKPPPVQLPKTDYVPAAAAAPQAKWKAQIVDVSAFLDAIVTDHAADNPKPPKYPLPDLIIGIRLDSRGVPAHTWLNTRARETKGKFQMPGVRVFNDTGLRAR